MDLYHRNFDAICAAIIKALTGKEYKVAPSKPAAPAQPAPSGTIYRVVTGSYANKANAEAQVAKLKAAGFDSFITTK